jgi:lycopene cyclase domain-containing protein
MKEYFILDLITLFAVILLDYFLKTKLIGNRKFWIFQLIVIVLTTIVDNYSSGRPIVIFNRDIILNLRVGNVPVENYLLGFNLMTLNLILFEKFVVRKHRE